MQVYVANPTLQHREFRYRIPGVAQERVIHIAAAGQEVLPDDLLGNALESVLKQLRIIGGVPKSEIHLLLKPKGLTYEVGPKPIAPDVIEEGLSRDEDARQDVAAEQMEKAGLAAYERAKTPNGHVVETTFEIVESTDRGPVRGKNAVNMEVVVSEKPERRAGRKREEAKA